MNKILNINLGGYPLTIDEDAYEYLEAYLDSIRRRFSESDGRDEILTDIESRLGELISENLGKRTIVMLPDVESAVQVMGKPEDFGADPIDNQRNMGSDGGRRQSAGGGRVHTGKRLFRDEEDASVGGVCSGLAAYFGVHDPLWVRLAFVLLAFLSFGFWVPVYILLWILVPPAKNSADRLAMRGEKINVDNIAREIEVGFDRFGKKMDEFGESAKKKSGGSARSFGGAVAGGVSVLGSIFGFVLRFIAKFGALILILIAVAMFIALIVSWTTGIWAAFTWAPYLNYFSPLSNGASYFWMANLFFVLGIPILGFILLMFRVLFKTQSPRWLGTILTVLWFVNLFSLVTFSVVGAKSFRTGQTISKTLDLNNIGSDTLRVTGTGVSESGFYWDGDDDWHGAARRRDGKVEFSVPVDIRVRKSRDGQFRMIQNIYARGSSDTEAMENASQVNYNVGLFSNQASIPLDIRLEPGQRWRNQKVKIFIEMPVGKSVVFDEKIYGHAAAEYDDYAKGNQRNYISKTPGRVFTMTSGGIACTECPGWGDGGYDYDNDYEEFILEGNFETEIRKGDNFSIQITGADADKKMLKSIPSGNQVTLTTEGKTTAAPVKVVITTRTFTTLISKNSGDVSITGFDEGRSSITLRGGATVRGYFDSNDLDVTIDGTGKVDLTGRGNELNATVAEGGTLEATSYRVDRANLSARDNSKVRVNVRDHYSSKSDATSTITVDGNARKQED